MAPLNFRLLLNSFQSQTAKSNKKAISLTTDTVDKLRPTTDPALQSIYNRFLPFYTAYRSLNLAVDMKEADYKGETFNFETILGGIGAKLRLWEGGVHAVFPEDSVNDLKIFPRKRTPFYAETYELRLEAIEALQNKLLDFTVANPSLVPIQADVVAYYTLAKGARETQQGVEGNDGTLRVQRENQRVATMNAYWGIVYGGLLGIYYDTPEIIGQYIDFGLLYDYKNEELIDSVNVPGSNIVLNVPLADVAVTPTTRLRLKNMSTTPGGLVIAYFAATAIDQPGNPPVGVALNPGDNHLGTAAELNYDPARPFFNIFNPSGVAVEVEIWEVK